MTTATNSVTIRRPIEDVFAVLTAVEQTGKWFPGDVEEHWTSPPPHGVGSTRHAVVRMFGRRAENDAVTTVYEPPHRAAIEGTSPTAPFLATLAFTTTGDGTRVDVSTELELSGAARLFGPLVGWVYGRGWSKGLARLKKMMEAGDL